MLNNWSVALSFTGDDRDYVGKVADGLAERLGCSEVFYDRYHEAELARLNLDTKLQDAYLEARLIVVFLCAGYSDREWCQLEWRAIREIIGKRPDDVMLVRLDNVELAEVKGLFSIDGFVDATLKTRPPKEIASLILTRLASKAIAMKLHLDQAWGSFDTEKFVRAFGTMLTPLQMPAIHSEELNGRTSVRLSAEQKLITDIAAQVEKQQQSLKSQIALFQVEYIYEVDQVEQVLGISVVGERCSDRLRRHPTLMSAPLNTKPRYVMLWATEQHEAYLTELLDHFRPAVQTINLVIRTNLTDIEPVNGIDGYDRGPNVYSLLDIVDVVVLLVGPQLFGLSEVVDGNLFETLQVYDEIDKQILWVPVSPTFIHNVPFLSESNRFDVVSTWSGEENVLHRPTTVSSLRDSDRMAYWVKLVERCTSSPTNFRPKQDVPIDYDRRKRRAYVRSRSGERLEIELDVFPLQRDQEKTAIEDFSQNWQRLRVFSRLALAYLRPVYVSLVHYRLKRDLDYLQHAHKSLKDTRGSLNDVVKKLRGLKLYAGKETGPMNNWILLSHALSAIDDELSMACDCHIRKRYIKASTKARNARRVLRRINEWFLQAECRANDITRQGRALAGASQ